MIRKSSFACHESVCLLPKSDNTYTILYWTCRKAPPSPDQFISAGSGLSFLHVAMATFPSAKPLPTRADLAWVRAILCKSSISFLKKDIELLAFVAYTLRCQVDNKSLC